ncbi:hypothetical protein [Acidipropionibacterium virtanenii]|uniref:hypothetical protein n=1 Tax=Acidipropionibacterium virtanenii TaxID=2057246 RepID=UPI001C691243|nr:hypothetical protein [Acidipropionibacterium virtanenii]
MAVEGFFEDQGCRQMGRAFRVVVRTLFAIVFIAGGIVHFVFGRSRPDTYAAFASTAAFPWLQTLWRSFVMPNIGWLTVVLGLYELACGLGMLHRRTVPVAAWGMTAFLLLILVLGYGFPAQSWMEDLLRNRAGTVAMILLLLPLGVRRAG